MYVKQYVIVNPRKSSSLLLNVNFCGVDCNRDTINLNTVLNTVITEKINTNRNIVLISFIISQFFFQLKFLFLTRPIVFSTFEQIV